MGILIIIAALTISYWLYRVYPPFGGKTPIETKLRSKNFVGRKFVNQIPTSMKMSASDMTSMMREQFRTSPSRKPTRTLSAEQIDTSRISTVTQPQITWLGHSAFLLQIDGNNLLLDPMFSKRASPLPFIGPERFVKGLSIEIEDLPHIDAVVISHDHYDHLDYDSIKRLRSKVTMFFVPLGVAAHLQKWGVEADNITELDWWQASTFQGMTITCTPARHFSGRTLTDRFATLWASWVIGSNTTRVYFSGDTGYGPHFKEIGDKLGPFDLTLLECGQYDSRWSNIHMLPEQTVTAHTDLRGKRLIPMHWGAFVLAVHGWTEPVERVLAAGSKVDAKIVTPKLGEIVAFKSDGHPSDRWWRAYEPSETKAS